MQMWVKSTLWIKHGIVIRQVDIAKLLIGLLKTNNQLLMCNHGHLPWLEGKIRKTTKKDEYQYKGEEDECKQCLTDVTPFFPKLLHEIQEAKNAN